MEAHPVEALNGHMIFAGVVLIAAYALIFSEKLHRTSAALIGAVVMVGAGMWAGFYTQEQALQSVDANTILLLLGMMLIISVLRPTGGFEYLAIRIAKLAGNSPRLLLVYLGLVVSVVSMFLDNVTTVIIFAPLTVLITRFLHISPLPYLMSEAMLSNIGGIATLVGDPPNIMIGSAAHIDFLRFMIHMTPIVSVAWIITTALLILMFRKELEPVGLAEKMDLDETQAIKQPKVLRDALIALGVILGLFFVHHHFHLYPSFAVFIGVAIAIALIRPDPEKILHEVEWTVLLFFAGLFIIVGGVDASGLLALIGNELAKFASDPQRLLITALLFMWVAAILSAVIDNIPFTVTMIPIVLSLEHQGINVIPLWWALALGVGLGGNGTHIGATANIICMVESERCGIPGAAITPVLWLRKGMPVMLLGLVVVSAVFVMFFGFFSA